MERTPGGDILKGAEAIELDTQTTAVTSWDGAVFDVSKFKEAIIACVITTFDRTDVDETLIYELQGSFDATTWAHLRTFVDEANAGDVTTVTGDADRGKIKATGTYLLHVHQLPKFIRMVATVAGSTPDIDLVTTGSFW